MQIRLRLNIKMCEASLKSLSAEDASGDFVKHPNENILGENVAETGSERKQADSASQRTAKRRSLDDLRLDAEQTDAIECCSESSEFLHLRKVSTRLKVESSDSKA